MSRPIKVRRSGIERIFKKVPFRHWLDEQNRRYLTYKPKTKIDNFEALGWKTEDFIRECWKRDLDVRIGTVNKWCQGGQPRPGLLNEVRKVFPDIRF